MNRRVCLGGNARFLGLLGGLERRRQRLAGDITEGEGKCRRRTTSSSDADGVDALPSRLVPSSGSRLPLGVFPVVGKDLRLNADGHVAGEVGGV